MKSNDFPKFVYYNNNNKLGLKYIDFHLPQISRAIRGRRWRKTNYIYNKGS